MKFHRYFSITDARQLTIQYNCAGVWSFLVQWRVSKDFQTFEEVSCLSAADVVVDNPETTILTETRDQW